MYIVIQNKNILIILEKGNIDMKVICIQYLF